MDVLCAMGSPGKLNEENRKRLTDSGVVINAPCIAAELNEKDIVTNYHVGQILSIRQDLLEALEKK